MANLTQAQQEAKARLDAITDQLVELQMNLEIEKGNIGSLTWGDAGELGFISEKLEEVIDFWNGGDQDA